MKQFLLMPLLAIFLLAACKKEEARVAPPAPATVSAASMLVASLADSLPESSLQAMNMVDVYGWKVVRSNGSSASYFEYVAAPEDVLRAVGRAAFPRYAVRADTTCRRISYESLAAVRTQLSNAEQQAGEFFWQAEPIAYDVYECIKGEHRHTLLIPKQGGAILHRVETAA